jgi:hypothetical protein
MMEKYGSEQARSEHAKGADLVPVDAAGKSIG